MYLHTDRWVRNHRHLYHSGWTFLFQLSPAFLNNLYIFAIGIAVILAIGMIIWGGTEIALNRGSVSSVMDGKGKISQALLGLLLVLSPALVFSIITPAILNLDVNMPSLNTKWETSGPVSSCTDPGGCSPYAPSSDTNIISPNSYQGLLPCKGAGCSETMAACTNNGKVSGTAGLVCGDVAGGKVSAQKFYGGAASVTASCPSGSSVVVLCTLSKPGLFCSVFGYL